MRKGISPLVAVVLLIAATMAIATVLTYWATTFIRSSLPEIANETYSPCVYADFTIYSCGYTNTTPDTGNITILLHNTRDATLKNITVFVFYPGNVIKTYSAEILPDNTLPGNMYKVFSVVNVQLPYKEIKITTHCPGVEKGSSCQQVL